MDVLNSIQNKIKNQKMEINLSKMFQTKPSLTSYSDKSLIRILILVAMISKISKQNLVEF